MLYGKDKPRHLARNLKSNRRNDNLKRRCNQQHRRRVQRSLQLALVDPEHWYDDPVINSDTRDRWLVRDNRAGLYLGPLWRWALCTGSELPAWSRLSYLQARLPDGDKCRLAQLHLPTWHDEFRWEPHDPRVQRRQREHEQQLE